jgi:hypothetical protein
LYQAAAPSGRNDLKQVHLDDALVTARSITRLKVINAKIVTATTRRDEPLANFEYGVIVTTGSGSFLCICTGELATKTFCAFSGLLARLNCSID